MSMDYQERILPFYMRYPDMGTYGNMGSGDGVGMYGAGAYGTGGMYGGAGMYGANGMYGNVGMYPREDTVLRDLEYLEQMYPLHAKKLQARVVQILDRMDYEGSLMYDEYPDKWQLYRLGESIVDILKREDVTPPVDTGTSEDATPPMDKWVWVADIVQLILYYEIYKRRQSRQRNFLKF